MSRIITNVNSLVGNRILGQNNQALSKSLERLSTGLAINRGADNPAGLIASEKLRAEKAAIGSAITNAQRADQVVNIAEGALQEINSLLVDLQSLVGATANEAGVSEDERKANQLQVDSILQTIDRIASSTSYQGTKLLNGNYAYTIDGVHASVDDYQVNGAKLEFGETQSVQVIVTNSAQHAGLYLSTDGALDLSAADARFVINVAGTKGSREFSFASGTALSAVVASINSFTSVTGVSAATQATGVVLKSTEFGADAFVSVDVSDFGGLTGFVVQLSSNNENTISTVANNRTAFSAMTGAIRDEGQDMGAIINGVTAQVTGKVASVSSDLLDLSLELSDTASQTLAAVDALTITGGGATFNVGPTVDINSKVGIGIQSVASRSLGKVGEGFISDLASGGAYNLVDGDLTSGQDAITAAIDKVSTLRGRLGAFQKNVIGSTIRSLSIALENTAAAESAIRDTDFAAETAALTRSQILVNASTQILGISNAQPQAVLALLG